ncbi:MAG: hypothetical protein RLP15_13780 [Cryomorphaceae bacterium]
MKTIYLFLISFFLVGLADAQETYNYSKVDFNETNETAVINAVEDAPDNLGANFEASKHYYNQGVGIIETLDCEAAFDALYAKQEEVEAMFTKALPYAKKVHSLDAKNAKVIKMLEGIYFGLNDLEMSRYYGSLLAELDAE